MSTTDSSALSEVAKNCTKSEMKLRNVTHLWAINDFDFFEAKKSTIISPEFSASTNEEIIWKLQLKPCGDYGTENVIGLFLVLSEKVKRGSRVYAKFQFFILDEQLKKEVQKWSEKVHEFTPGHSSGFCRFCEKNENFRLKCLSNNVLKILCEVTYSTEKDVVEHHPTFADRDVTKNLDILFKTQLLADVVISVEGKDFPAHKAILAARSKVFAAMFQHDTKEKEENRIEIKEMNEEIANEMLRFIYTGRCNNLDKLAGKLFVAADKYDLDVLKTICTEYLCQNLSIENAAENLILADTHKVDDLKTCVINFIVAQPAKVLKSAGWESVLSYPELIDEVFQAVAQKSGNEN